MLKNERGSTLITVLMIIVIFTVIGLSIVGMSVNNIKQVSKTGNDIQATNLAEMGVVQLKQMLFSTLKNNSQLQVNSEILLSALLSALKETVNSSPYTIVSGKSASFIIGTPLNSDVTFDNTASNKDTISVKFTSTGNSENQQRKNITGTLVFMRPKPVAFPVKNPPDVIRYSDAQEFKKLDKMPTTNSLYFDLGFSLKSEKSRFDLPNNYNLYSSGTIYQENKTTLRVTGNAHLNSINQKPNGNEALMCIKGTLFLYNGKPSNFDTDYHEDPTYSCENKMASKNAGEHGVYASKIIIYQGAYENVWDMNNISFINLQYK